MKRSASIGHDPDNIEERKGLGGGFGAENALEARAGELHTDELLAFGLGFGNMHNAAVGGKVRIVVSGACNAVDAP